MQYRANQGSKGTSRGQRTIKKATERQYGGRQKNVLEEKRQTYRQSARRNKINRQIYRQIDKQIDRQIDTVDRQIMCPQEKYRQIDIDNTFA